MNCFCMAIIDLHGLIRWKLQPSSLVVENIHLSRKVILQNVRDKKERQKLKGAQRSLDEMGSGKRKSDATPVVKKRLRKKGPPATDTPPEGNQASSSSAPPASEAEPASASAPVWPHLDFSHFDLLHKIRRQVSHTRL